MKRKDVDGKREGHSRPVSKKSRGSGSSTGATVSAAAANLLATTNQVEKVEEEEEEEDSQKLVNALPGKRKGEEKEKKEESKKTNWFAMLPMEIILFIFKILLEIEHDALLYWRCQDKCAVVQAAGGRGAFCCLTRGDYWTAWNRSDLKCRKRRNGVSQFDFLFGGSMFNSVDRRDFLRLWMCLPLLNRRNVIRGKSLFEPLLTAPFEVPGVGTKAILLVCDREEEFWKNAMVPKPIETPLCYRPKKGTLRALKVGNLRSIEEMDEWFEENDAGEVPWDKPIPVSLTQFLYWCGHTRKHAGRPIRVNSNKFVGVCLPNMGDADIEYRCHGGKEGWPHGFPFSAGIDESGTLYVGSYLHWDTWCFLMKRREWEHLGPGEFIATIREYLAFHSDLEEPDYENPGDIYFDTCLLPELEGLFEKEPSLLSDWGDDGSAGPLVEEWEYEKDYKLGPVEKKEDCKNKKEKRK